MGATIDIDNKIDWIAFYSARLQDKPRPAGTHKYHARCPFHQDSDPSFWFNTTNGLWRCEAGCGSGNATSFIARQDGVSNKEAWRQLCDLAGVDIAQAKKPRTRLPLTVEEYAKAKHIPVEFLAGLGVKTQTDENGFSWVAIPAYGADGACSCVKRRYHPDNYMRFSYDEGGTVIPYGVWLRINKEADRLILCEGESDAQSLWLNHIPALGIPGASSFQQAWVAFLPASVCIHVEPDKGGEGFKRKISEMLRNAGYAGKVTVFSCNNADQACKDPSDLWIKHPDNFAATIKSLVDGATPIDLIEATARQAVETQPAKRTSQLKIYRASELYGKEIVVPPLIVKGMLPVGLSVLGGPPKKGKSWLALSLGIAVASGQKFLGAETEQGDVLYLDLESSESRLQSRLTQLMPGQPPDRLFVSHSAARLDGGFTDDVKDWMAGVQHPVLVIVDTLGRVKSKSNRGENAYENDTRIYGDLQRFAIENRIAILGIHHLKKSGIVANDDYFERLSGSMGLTGVCDCVMVLEGKRGENTATFKYTSRDIEDAELILQRDGGVWSLVSTDSEAYRQESEYANSAPVRCAIRLMHTRDRWEGTPAQLLEDLCMTGAAPIDGTPKQVTDELVKWQEMLYERESLILKRGRSHNGRFVKIEKIRTDGF